MAKFSWHLIVAGFVMSACVSAGGQQVELVVDGDFESGGVDSPWQDANFSGSVGSSGYIYGLDSACGKLDASHWNSQVPPTWQVLASSFVGGAEYEWSWYGRYLGDPATDIPKLRFQVGYLDDETFTPVFSIDQRVHNAAPQHYSGSFFAGFGSELDQPIVVWAWNPFWLPMWIDNVSLLGPDNAEPPPPPDHLGDANRDPYRGPAGLRGAEG